MEWFQRRRAEQLREFDRSWPPMAELLRELDAVYLCGWFGFDAVMRRDGSVLVAVDERWGELDAPEPPWRSATPKERTMALVAAAERWPELEALAPARPATANECTTCNGEGKIPLHPHSMLCSDCGALGWRDDAAT